MLFRSVSQSRYASTAGTGSKLLQTWEFGGVAQSVMDISGSLGIGTGSAPPARLFISGANDQSLLRVGSPTNQNILFVSGSGLVGIGTTTPGVELDVIGNIRANFTMFNSTTQTQRIRINSTTHLAFQNTSSIEVARFDNAGNWGIGTTNPQRRLHVDASGSSNTNVPLVLTSVDTNNRVGILFASSILS